jgi:putative transposase
MSIKSFKYRIYPNQAIIEKLEWTLDRCRELYNAALQERKEAWKYERKSIGRYDQQNDLPEIKNEIRPEYKEIGAHILQNIILRVDKAFKSFFKRVKAGKKPGFPRFKGKNWYDSFSSDNGYKLIPDERNKKKACLKIQYIGNINVRFHRPIEGRIKTYTVKREGEHWYVVFSCEVEAKPLEKSYEDAGIDLGITHFAALSNGDMIDNPRHYRKAEKKLKKLQEALSRKKKGSHRRKKAVKVVARAHRKIRNQRKDFHHKESRKLVNRYQVIVFEDLAPANLSKAPKPKQDENGNYLPNGAAAKGGLNKSILDAGWYSFTEMVKAKAESAGRTVLFVNPSYTSQACSGCGTIRKKDLSERWHSCECGCELDRDTNAAVNILTLGQKQLQARTEPTRATA